MAMPQFVVREAERGSILVWRRRRGRYYRPPPFVLGSAIKCLHSTRVQVCFSAMAASLRVTNPSIPFQDVVTTLGRSIVARV